MLTSANWLSIPHHINHIFKLFISTVTSLQFIPNYPMLPIVSLALSHQSARLIPHYLKNCLYPFHPSS